MFSVYYQVWVDLPIPIKYSKSWHSFSDPNSQIQKYLFELVIILNSGEKKIFRNLENDKYSNLIFETLFPNSPMTQFLLADTETDEKFKNTLTFKDLGIEKQDIIAIFIAEGILPKNFLDLKDAPVTLPRLKNEVKA